MEMAAEILVKKWRNPNQPLMILWLALTTPWISLVMKGTIMEEGKVNLEDVMMEPCKRWFKRLVN